MPGLFTQSYSVRLSVDGSGEGVLESDLEPQIVFFSVVA